jgi:hypothetical protein
MTAPQGQHSSVAPTHRVVVVHRVGAVVVAVVIAAFGVLGFVGGLDFFDTRGAPVLGLSSNGLLSTVSIVTAVVLVLAAARGGRLSSTVMIVVGALFIVSAFANLGVMTTPYNVLAFRWPNVVFSIVAGLVLLFLGGYGRLSAGLPADNPYRAEHASEDTDHADPHAAERSLPFRAGTRAERDADVAMAQAARAIAAGSATPEQRRRMDEVDRLRAHEDRRDRWMALVRRDEQSTGGSATA